MPRHALSLEIQDGSLSQNQEPIRNKNCINISFQLLLYLIQVKYQQDQ